MFQGEAKGKVLVLAVQNYILQARFACLREIAGEDDDEESYADVFRYVLDYTF